MIPFARPSLSETELESVGEVFDTRWLGQGKVTQEFEEALSARFDDRPVLATNTGTTAMHLALEAAGIGPGDDVIVPAFTFVATAQAVVMAGATPVICDIDAETLNVDLECLERALTPRTRAVMPVHYRGLPIELDEILAWAQERQIRVIEDAAHAFGSEYADGTPVGARGDLTCFSFDPIKNVTTGEGGCIVFRDEEECDRARKMAVLGIDSTAWGRLERKRAWVYDVLSDGFRYHMPNFCAAIGLRQLERADSFRERKQAVLGRYQDAFRDHEHLEIREMPVERVFPFMAQVLVSEREQFMSLMKERGVGTGVHYIPVHHFTRFSEGAAGELVVADELSKRICTLPLLNDQTDEECEQVIEAVASFAPEPSPVG